MCRQEKKEGQWPGHRLAAPWPPSPKTGDIIHTQAQFAFSHKFQRNHFVRQQRRQERKNQYVRSSGSWRFLFNVLPLTWKHTAINQTFPYALPDSSIERKTCAHTFTQAFPVVRPVSCTSLPQLQLKFHRLRAVHSGNCNCS